MESLPSTEIVAFDQKPAASFTPGESWPQAMADDLRRLHEDEGKSFAVCAAELNGKYGTSLTRNACVGKYKRMGGTGKGSNVPHVTRQTARRRRERPKPSWAISLAHEDKSLNCTLAELDSPALRRKCRFMSGEPADDVYCGQPTVEGHSWCAFHCRIVYL